MQQTNFCHFYPPEGCNLITSGEIGFFNPCKTNFQPAIDITKLQNCLITSLSIDNSRIENTFQILVQGKVEQNLETFSTYT